MDFTTLHPMLVHFPIALLIVAVISDLAGLLLKREFFNRMGLLLLLLGTAGLIATYLSGRSAADGLTETGSLKMAIETHEEAAELTLWLMIATTVIRLGLIGFRKYTGMIRWIPLALFLVGVASLARTGYYGGELVFKHAAGVQLNLGAFGADTTAIEQTEDD